MQEITIKKDAAQVTQKRYRFHYGWVVVVITFLTLLISSGIRSTPGVLIVPLEQYFHWNRTVITFALAINLLLYGLGGPFAAALIEKYGLRRITMFALVLLALGTSLSTWMKAPWQLILTWGIMVGLGSSFISMVLGAIVGNLWFKKHKGLVVGLLSASGATGQVLFLPLIAKAEAISGWQTAVWIIAITSFVITISVFFFMRNKPSDLGLLPYGATEPDNVQVSSNINPLLTAFNGLKVAIKSREFWLLSSSFFVCGASSLGLIGTHFIPAATEKGINQVTAASLLALTGFFTIFGTTASGWLTDRYDSRWLLFWYYGLRGMALLFLPHVLGHSNISLFIFVFFYGLDAFATIPPTVRLSSEIFNKQGSIVYGWIFAMHQIGAASAAFGGGVLHNWVGDYQAAFISGGILCLVASGLVIRIRRIVPVKN